MSKQKQEKFVEPWKNIAAHWKKLGPPARPCKKNIQDYKKFLNQVIQKKKFPKILIFGATPELRDIVTLHKNVEITVVDFNIEMLLAMTELMRHKDKKSREIWVKSDWLKLPLKENYYDVLMGDCLFQNIPHLKQLFFLEKCHNFLKKGGYFITRVGAKYPEAEVYKFKDLLKEYLKKEYNNKSFDDFWSVALFCSNIRKNHKTGIKILLNEIKKYIQDPKVKKLYKKIRTTFSEDKEWTYFEWKRDKKMIEKYFILKDIAEEPKKSKVFKWMRILKLKNRPNIIK